MVQTDKRHEIRGKDLCDSKGEFFRNFRIRNAKNVLKESNDDFPQPPVFARDWLRLKFENSKS